MLLYILGGLLQLLGLGIIAFGAMGILASCSMQVAEALVGTPFTPLTYWIAIGIIVVGIIIFLAGQYLTKTSSNSSSE